MDAKERHVLGQPEAATPAAGRHTWKHLGSSSAICLPSLQPIWTLMIAVVQIPRKRIAWLKWYRCAAFDARVYCTLNHMVIGIPWGGWGWCVRVCGYTGLLSQCSHVLKTQERIQSAKLASAILNNQLTSPFIITAACESVFRSFLQDAQSSV